VLLFRTAAPAHRQHKVVQPRREMRWRQLRQEGWSSRWSAAGDVYLCGFAIFHGRVATWWLLLCDQLCSVS